MNDLISRQAAIKAVHDEFDECLVWDESGRTTADEVEMILDGLPPAEPRWIPLEDKPPKEPRRYWVCTDTGYQCSCRWTNDIYGLGESDRWGWSIADIPQYSKVVAYMPLPQPYERSEDE